jgi:hypothetical protein
MFVQNLKTFSHVLCILCFSQSSLSKDIKTKLLNLQPFMKLLLLKNNCFFPILILKSKVKLTMTKPRIRTVNKRYDDYYDESEEEIDDVLAKLDFTKERTAKVLPILLMLKKRHSILIPDSLTTWMQQNIVLKLQLRKHQ